MRRSTRLTYPALLIIVAIAPLVAWMSPAAHSQVAATTATRDARLEERDKLEKQAKALRAQGKTTEALQAALAVLAIDREVLGETSDKALFSFVLVGSLHQDRGDWAAAVSTWSKVHAILTKRLGKDHWQVVDALWVMKKAEALAKLNEQARRKLLGADERIMRADALYVQGNFAEALKVAREVVATRRELQGEQNPDYATSLWVLGTALHAATQDGEALDCHLRALKMRQALYPRANPKVAESLDSLSAFRWDQGDYAEARQYAEGSLKIRQALFPPDSYPKGDPNLALSLYNLGIVLHSQGAYREARGYYEKALEMRESLYPKSQYPHGHELLIVSLNGLGTLYVEEGNYARARHYLERALDMSQALYPKEKYPRGHLRIAVALSNMAWVFYSQGATGPARRYLERAVEMDQALSPQAYSELAKNLTNLGTLLRDQGDYAAARRHFERAVNVCEFVYPKHRFPNGHRALATALSSLGSLLAHERRYAEARPYLERALQMMQGLYPRELYARGHPDLVGELNLLGYFFVQSGNLDEGRRYLERSLEMTTALFDKASFPHGHPLLAESLNNLGTVLWAQGNYDEARGRLEQALDMYEQWYPKETYPHGRGALAVGLASFGSLLEAEGKHAEAWRYFERASTMFCDLAEVFAAAASEAEALDYMSQTPSVRGYLISCSFGLPDTAEAAYGHVWRGKAAVAQLLRRRQASLADRAGIDPATRQLLASWTECRRELASLMLASSDGRTNLDRVRRLHLLAGEKEKLERQLAELSPDFVRDLRTHQSKHTELQKALPSRTALIDLVRYTRIAHDAERKGYAGQRWDVSYAGFVLAHGRPIRRVDLGPAAPVDEAVRNFRAAIVEKERSAVAAALRRLIWEPLAREFPSDTSTVLIAPDGLLTALPWAALPGERPDSVLLERYALAIVPHAPFVLDLLTAPTRDHSGRAKVLGVGGLIRRVPGAADEVDMVMRLAGSKPVVRLMGPAATTAAVLRELPLARWSHFDTHGFFADPSEQLEFRPNSDPFQQLRTAGPRFLARNPLVLSGLAVAATSQTSGDQGKTMDENNGILTAEAIAGLPLDGLDLAVLSACETGLGTVAGGEGVFGLQRAFHLAGARTVVASLWIVEDRSTQALMTEFYKNLWSKELPKLEALRQAQLTLMKQYTWSATRGLVGPSAGAEFQRLPPLYWAGFVLSGDWR